MTARQLASSNWILNGKYLPIDNRMLCSRKPESSSALVWQPEILYCSRVIWFVDFLFFACGLFNDTVYITRQTAVSVRVIGEWWIWNVLERIGCGLCKVLSHHLLKEGGDWANSRNTSVTISGVWDEIQTRLIFFTTWRFGSGQQDEWKSLSSKNILLGNMVCYKCYCRINKGRAYLFICLYGKWAR
jgi:hypothetical protein